MNTKRLSKFALYALSLVSVLAVCALLERAGLASAFMSVYAPIAFFAVAGIDYFRRASANDFAEEVAAYQNAGNYRPGVFQDQYGFVRVAPIGQNPPPAAVTPRSGSCFADRVLAYIFVAPFIFPARLFELVSSR